MKAVSVILIAHDEEQAIGRMLEGLLANYDQEILEIIVVNDASKDRTAEIVETWSKRNAKVILVKRRPPCGVGRALKAGFNRINPKAECVLSNTRHGRAMRGCLRHNQFDRESYSFLSKEFAEDDVVIYKVRSELAP